MHVTRTTSDNKDFHYLIAELDQYLWDMDGPELQKYYKKLNVIEKNDTVIIAYIDEAPIGCGCFKPYNKTSVEIKRMYAKPEIRGKGIGYAVLHALELWAAELGYKTAVLETGHKQVEAIGLYKKSGYKQIENYGPYAGIANSLCFEKKIG
jgi:putative acetyltransferase